MKYLASWILLVMAVAAIPANAANELVLGVQDTTQNRSSVVRQYRGLATYLKRILKQEVSVETAKTLEEFLAGAKSGRYTMMYGPPSMIMAANKQAGYQPIAKVPGRLAPYFMSFAKTGISFPEDMKGKRIGFPGEQSMITQLGLAHLRGEKIDPATYFKSVVYFGDADSVLSAMKNDVIDIGVANSSLLDAWTGKGHDISLVMQGTGVPHLTFAVKKGFPEKKLLTEALLKAQKDPDGQDYFTTSRFPNFEAANLEDYDELVKILQIK